MSHTFALHVPDDLSMTGVLALNIDLERPFGELPIETRCLIFALHQTGKIDVLILGGLVCLEPVFRSDRRYQIRRKEAPLVPDSIDWSHVSPEWKFMARDSDGKSFLYKERPSVRPDSWWYATGELAVICGFASYKRGTVDWKDSLVVRPE